MTNKIKQWLIRRSKDVKKQTGINEVLLIIGVTLHVTGTVSDNIFAIGTGLLVMILAILLELIGVLFYTVNRKRDILIVNKMFFVLLSDEKFVFEYSFYLVIFPIISYTLCLGYNMLNENMIIGIILLILLVLLYIFLLFLNAMVSEKISNIFKKKLL